VFVRVVRFSDVNAERIDGLLARIEDSDGPPPGVPSTGLTILHDGEQGTAVVLQYFATAEDMEAGAKAFSAIAISSPCSSNPPAAASRLYEEGRVVNGVDAVGVGAFRVAGGGERRSSLYCLLIGRTRRHWRPAPGAQVQKGRQAARRKVEPPGAGVKGWLLVSMCQIASVSFLAMSIWATLAPRWRPRRRLVRW
jgi:hypothetical protein